MMRCRCVTGEQWRCPPCQAKYCLALIAALRVADSPPEEQR